MLPCCEDWSSRRKKSIKSGVEIIRSTTSAFAGEWPISIGRVSRDVCWRSPPKKWIWLLWEHNSKQGSNNRYFKDIKKEKNWRSWELNPVPRQIILINVKMLMTRSAKWATPPSVFERFLGSITTDIVKTLCATWRDARWKQHLDSVKVDGWTCHSALIFACRRLGMHD